MRRRASFNVSRAANMEKMGQQRKKLHINTMLTLKFLVSSGHNSENKGNITEHRDPKKSKK